MISIAPLILILGLNSSSIAGQEIEKLNVQNGNKEVSKTLKQLFENNPLHFRRVFRYLDIGNSDLIKVKVALSKGDTLTATENLLKYYQQAHHADWITKTKFEGEPEELMKVAQLLLQDTLTFGSSTAKIRRNKNGTVDWHYTGPDKDDEFGYTLNGHKYFGALMYAWQTTHDEAYVACFNQFITDWILNNPLPQENKPMYEVFTNPRLDWRDIGEVVWRDLEAGKRLESSWPLAFYFFQKNKSFSPVARLLMLSSLIEHAEYLQKYHKKGHNWTTMEMNGLALFALTFVEFNKSNEWAAYAMRVMESEIGQQVYLDGVQTEISSKTQWVALKPFETIADNFKKAGRKVNDNYTTKIIDMYNFLAYSMRPDGHQILNNDSDREDLRPRVLVAAEKYNRPDWKYVATNGGEGQMPTGLSSKVFPWAGINVLRNNWGKDAHWFVFDTGPFGTGHQHADMLHISLAAFGKDLLVDGGRYTHKDYFSFDPIIWRGYFRSSFSHNTILVDGKGQKAGPLRATVPLKEGHDFINTPKYDYARGTFLNGYEGVEGKVTHTRSVLYLKEKFFVVMDQIETDQARKLEALWHFAPDGKVTISNNTDLITTIDEANLQILPLGLNDHQLKIIKGQESPYIQGWYSADYGLKVPNNTAIYTQDSSKSSTFLWLLVPSKGHVSLIKASILSKDADYIKVNVSIDNEPHVQIDMPLKAGKAVSIN
ncbi:MAG: alginate lyase family protein [Spirosomataceae bacterium]